MRYGTWLIVTALLGAVALGTYALAPLFGRLMFRGPSRVRPAVSDTTPLTPAAQERMTTLVLGVDERTSDAGRSDTLMVAQFDPETGGISLISIPRDTRVNIPDHGWDKINHAYAFGGEQLALETVERFLDMPIQHYAVINFSGFRSMVDAVGGVEINVREPMHYDDPYEENGGLHIHFESGRQQMNGQKALEYARFRSDEQGDVGRMQRQQEVIRAVLAKAMTPAVVLRIPALVRSLAETVRTDLGLGDLLQLAAVARDKLGQGQRQMTLLEGLRPQDLDGVSYLIPDLPQVRTQAYRLLQGAEPPAAFIERARSHQVALEQALAVQVAAAAERAPAPTQVARVDDAPARPEPASRAARPATKAPVAMVDYSGHGHLDAWSQHLQSAGFRVVSARTGAYTLPGTLILDRSGGDAELLARVKQTFPWARAMWAEPNGEYSIEVLLGQDTPVRSQPPAADGGPEVGPGGGAGESPAQAPKKPAQPSAESPANAGSKSGTDASTPPTSTPAEAPPARASGQAPADDAKASGGAGGDAGGGGGGGNGGGSKTNGAAALPGARA